MTQLCPKCNAVMQQVYARAGHPIGWLCETCRPLRAYPLDADFRTPAEKAVATVWGHKEPAMQALLEYVRHGTNGRLIVDVDRERQRRSWDKDTRPKWPAAAFAWLKRLETRGLVTRDENGRWHAATEG